MHLPTEGKQMELMSSISVILSVDSNKVKIIFFIKKWFLFKGDFHGLLRYICEMYIRKWTHCTLVNAGGACRAGNPGAKALSLEKIITLFIGLVLGTVALPFLVLISEFFFIFLKKKKKIQAVSSDRGSNPIGKQCTVMLLVHF